MHIKNVLKSFWSDEAGAVTVDWVVLTAAIVGLAIAVVSVIAGGTQQLADNIAHVLGTHYHP